MVWDAATQVWAGGGVSLVINGMAKFALSSPSLRLASLFNRVNYPIFDGHGWSLINATISVLLSTKVAVAMAKQKQSH